MYYIGYYITKVGGLYLILKALVLTLYDSVCLLYNGNTYIGAILKPCGTLGGRGAHEKSTSVQEGGGGLLVLSKSTKYTRFFRCIF